MISRLIVGKFIVIDSNIVVNRVLETHPFHAQSKRLLDWCEEANIQLLAPPLFETEVDNSVRLMLNRKLIETEKGILIFRALDKLPIKIIQDSRVRLLARQIADQIGHPRVGDATYAALAQTQNCQFWTADASFARAADKMEVVRFVGELNA